MRARRALLALALCLAACDPRGNVPAAPSAAPRSPDVIRREGNHLVGQPSPYLEQHAHNPVDWYPWGPEALERARHEHKLLFVSIGYSTCHWCHVMEKESFEDLATAQLLNDRFVSIKIDREERPDLDALFVEAVQRMGESAGWPLNVILTPDLTPVFGGTYFPPVAKGGRPGLSDVLREVDQRFHEDGPALARRGEELLAQIAAEARAATGAAEVSEDLLRAAMFVAATARDTTEGGFGKRQKFPDTPLLLAELRWFERSGDAAAKAHLALTLDRMRRGGVRDQISGSFHRYAVDRAWRVPHFEKTLYDNAQLAALYLEASRALGDPSLASVTRAVLDDLLAAWQRPDGGFIVGFDADDPAGEGAFYTFTPAELDRALGPADARLVAALYEVGAGERSLGGRSVLRRGDEADVAGKLGVTPAALDEAWARSRPKLAAMRAARPAPAADDKELASWNGLAVAALADAGRALDEPRYIAAAQRAARFLVDRCWDAGARVMRRGVRRGAPLGEGFLDDHALAALALLRLHAADGDPAWLVHARAITAAIVERFHDDAQSTFSQASIPPGPRASADVGPLPLRRPDTDDGVLPSGSSAAMLLFVELGAMTGDADLSDRGARALRAAADRLRTSPFSSGFALVAVDHLTGNAREVVIAGDASDPRTAALARELRATTDARVLPIFVPAAGPSPELSRLFPALVGKNALKGKPTAFVCRHGACDAPVDEPAALRDKLPLR